MDVDEMDAVLLRLHALERKAEWASEHINRLTNENRALASFAMLASTLLQAQILALGDASAVNLSEAVKEPAHTHRIRLASEVNPSTVDLLKQASPGNPYLEFLSEIAEDQRADPAGPPDLRVVRDNETGPSQVPPKKGDR